VINLPYGLAGQVTATPWPFPASRLRAPDG